MRDLAKGICDRCGLTFRLSQLKAEVVAGRLVNNRVCPDCYDPDHPQLLLRQLALGPEGVLTDPRPDANPGRGFFGWKPVGDPVSLCATGHVGSVRVTTS